MTASWMERRRRPGRRLLLLAVLVGITSAGFWRGALAQRRLGTVPIPAPGQEVVGGPFQRVVYNVNRHLAVAVPGVFEDGPLHLQARAVRYDDQSHIAWTDGPCSVTDGPASASAGAGTADFGRRTVSLQGGVQFHLASTLRDGRPFLVNLSCPIVTYATDTSVVACSGGVTARVNGLEDLAGTTLASLPSTATGLRSSGDLRGPLVVLAPVLTYDARGRVLAATGGVQLFHGDVRLQAASLRFDAAHSLVRLEGGVGYSDSSGRQVHGQVVTEDLHQKTVLVTGPLQYTDRSGNRVSAAEAAMDQRSGTVSLTGNVIFTDRNGMQADTPFVVIRLGKNSAESVRTGPLHLHGAAALGT